MVWTKATFWLVADTLRAETERGFVEDGAYEAIERIANDFADAFAQSNPRFDRAKFIKACGLEN